MGYFCSMSMWYPLSLVACLLLLPSGKRHDFYVGLTEVVYNSSAKTYEVSIKLFTDDLELAIEKATGNNLKLGTEQEQENADSLVFAYVSKHFNIGKSPSSATTLTPVGRETELDITWIYLESASTKPYTSLVMMNELLMEVYPSQTHVVHVKQGGNVSTELIHKDKRTAAFKW